MLNVNTLPKETERWRINVRRRRRKTKTKDENERRKASIEKEQKKLKNVSNKCVSSQKIRMRKEEGATATASHLPFLSWPLRQAGPAAFYNELLPNQWERVIKYRKCPTNETWNVKRETWNLNVKRKTPAIFRHSLIGSPIQMNKYKDADESDKNISDLKHKNVNDTNNNCS